MHTSQAGLDLIKTFEGGNLSDSILEKLEDDINHLVVAPINQHQFDALISFTSNMGVDALLTSNILSRINNLENPADVAKEELHKWNKEGNKVFQGLSRRRSAELDLFCHPLPEYKWGWIYITSKCPTFLKKRPEDIRDLSSEEIASICSNRTIRRCQVLERSDDHTHLELGGNLGSWWILDKHWKGLKTEVTIKPYAINGDLIYLRNFPYYHREQGDVANRYHSQAYCILMCLKYLDATRINDVNEYLKLVNKHGDPIKRENNLKVIRDLGFTAYFTLSADSDDIKEEIQQGLPFIASIVPKRNLENPVGRAHFVVIIGYTKDSWLVQDPFGSLDLINGGWTNRSSQAGQNILYKFEHFNKRLFIGGGATGWGWKGFREK